MDGMAASDSGLRKPQVEVRRPRPALHRPGRLLQAAGDPVLRGDPLRAQARRDALAEALPDHSSLTRIRQRLGIDIFERFFEHIVDLCQAAGLVWGRELYVDATKVRANADPDSLVPRFAHEARAHLAEDVARAC